MAKDLNRLVREKLEGIPDAQRQRSYESFLQRWGRLFPNAPPKVDDFLDEITKQMARMDSLMRSLSPEMRRQLGDLMDAVFGDPELQAELAELGAGLEMLSPRGGLGSRYSFFGGEQLPLDEAMQLMGRLQSMEELERSLREVYHGGQVPPDTRAQLQRHARRGRRAQPRRALADGARARGARAGAARRQRPAAHRAGHAPHRPEGARRPLRAAAQGPLRRAHHRPARPARGARRGQQAVRVRRSLRPRRRAHRHERRAAPGVGGSRARRRPAAAARRLRGAPQRRADPLVDGAHARHEPQHAAARLLLRRQEGGAGARLADPQPVPARLAAHHRLQRHRSRDQLRPTCPTSASTSTCTAPTCSTG